MIILKLSKHQIGNSEIKLTKSQISRIKIQLVDDKIDKSKARPIKTKSVKVEDMLFSDKPRVNGKIKSSLINAGIKTTKALASKSDKKLLEIKGISEGSLSIIRSVL